ncbi:MAG: winged helix-turn-helix domain-containing protein, partial [Chloroflexota bacterium]|nr:winged helix-turn-helix domain-containing protein [Chloroflexota bacterium]
RIGSEALPALIAALAPADTETRLRIISVLGGIGDERARKPLRAQLADRRARQRAEEALSRLRPSPAYTVHLKTLGTFEVWRGVEPVADREWKTARAKSLLQLLASRRGQFLSKERILEILWPDAEPEAADNSFRFTLSTLNKVLEPQRPEGSLPYFIVRRGDSYGLEPSSQVTIDSEEFTRLVRAARALPRELPSAVDEAQELYSRALELYTDDYLPEQVYEDWTSAERERLRELYFIAAGDLADLLLQRGDVDRVVALCRSVLDRDPCREDATRLLMRAHLARGDRTGAVRAYQACVSALNRDLGLDPLPETVQLYREVRQS